MLDLELKLHSNFKPTSLVDIAKERKARQRRFKQAAIPLSEIKRFETQQKAELEARKQSQKTAEMSKRYLADLQNRRLAREAQEAVENEKKRAARKLERYKEFYDSEEHPQNFKTMRQIAFEVALKYVDEGVVYADLFSARRKANIVLAKFEAYWRCRNETPKTLPEIGRFFGGRDHTTVLHGVNKYQSYIDAGEIPNGFSSELLVGFEGSEK